MRNVHKYAQENVISWAEFALYFIDEWQVVDVVESCVPTISMTNPCRIAPVLKFIINDMSPPPCN